MTILGMSISMLIHYNLLSERDRKAIKDYIRGTQRVITSKISNYYRASPEHRKTETEEVRDFILQISRLFCPNCRKAVVSEIQEIEDREK